MVNLDLSLWNKKRYKDMRGKKDIIEIHNMQDDFEQSREFVEQILKKDRN